MINVRSGDTEQGWTEVNQCMMYISPLLKLDLDYGSLQCNLFEGSFCGFMCCCIFSSIRIFGKLWPQQQVNDVGNFFFQLFSPLVWIFGLYMAIYVNVVVATFHMHLPKLFICLDYKQCSNATAWAPKRCFSRHIFHYFLTKGRFLWFSFVIWLVCFMCFHIPRIRISLFPLLANQQRQPFVPLGLILGLGFLSVFHHTGWWTYFEL